MNSGCSRGPEATAEDLLTDAEAALASENYEAARRTLALALQSEPDNAAARWRLAELEFGLGRFAFARTHLSRALAEGMSASTVLPLLAKSLLFEEDVKTLSELEIPQSTAPAARADVLASKARGYLLSEQPDRAREMISQAAAVSPSEDSVAIARALLARYDGDLAEAEDILRGVVTRSENNAEGLALLADAVRDSGRYEEAETLYGLAIDEAILKVPYLFLRGEVRLDLGRLDAAEEDATALEAIAPASFAAHYLRGRILLARNQPQAAISAFEIANKMRRSHVGTLLFGGVAAYAAGSHDLAEDWLSRVLKAQPGSAGARLILGAIRFRQGRYANVVNLVGPVADVRGGNPLPRRLLAAALVAQDRADEAVVVLTDLVSDRPDDPRTQLDLSAALILSGADADAVGELGELIARHPDYRPAYEYLIAFYVREEDWAQADYWADQLVQSRPDDPNAAFLKGEVALASGRIDVARGIYEQILARVQSHPDANLRLGALSEESGDRALARSLFLRILADDPNHLRALLALSALAASEHRSEEAAELLRRSVDVHPRSLAPRMALARLLLEQGEAQQAAAVLEDGAPDVFRRDSEYLRLLAECLVEVEAPQRAVAIARELVALEHDSLDAYGLYARVLMLLDDKVALEEVLKQMLAIDDTHVPTRLELVRLNIATERYQVAERVLQPLLQTLDRPALADFYFGLILSATGRQAQAIAPLEHAHKRLGNRQTLLALANAEAASGRTEDAIARERSWLGQHPDDIEVRINLAGHLADAGQVSDAIALYRQVVDAQPDHVVALNNLAWYTLGRDPTQAAEYARVALEAKPDSLEVAHTLVLAQVTSGEWRDAELTLDRALARYPADSSLLWLSARVLHNKGRRQEALRRLERSLGAGLPEDERERAKELLVQIEDELRAEEAEKAW